MNKLKSYIIAALLLTSLVSLLSDCQTKPAAVDLERAVPYKNGVNELVIDNPEVNIRIEEKEDMVYLQIISDSNFPGRDCRIVSGPDLGEAMVPEAVFDNPDGSLLFFNRDYYNESRHSGENKAGPFANIGTRGDKIKLWPK